MEELVLSLMCVSVLSLMVESLVQTVSALSHRCLTGFNGHYCETGDSAISSRANQDDEASQTGMYIVPQLSYNNV